jgi:hypothetical protein
MVTKETRGRRVAGAIALVALLCGCGSLPWNSTDRRATGEDREVYRARMEKEVEVAVSVPGTKVCRQLTVGIGNRDWVKGVVVEAASGNISVRIDEPGRYQHSLNGLEIRRGTVVRDSVGSWTPCL